MALDQELIKTVTNWPLPGQGAKVSISFFGNIAVYGSDPTQRSVFLGLVVVVVLVIDPSPEHYRGGGVDVLRRPRTSSIFAVAALFSAKTFRAFAGQMTPRPNFVDEIQILYE